MFYRTRAPFHMNGKWHWITWTNQEPNKHAAVINKAQELKADRWDYGQTDHEELDRAGF